MMVLHYFLLYIIELKMSSAIECILDQIFSFMEYSFLQIFVIKMNSSILSVYVNKGPFLLVSLNGMTRNQIIKF